MINKSIDVSQNGSAYTFITNSGISLEKRFKIVTSPEVVTKSQKTVSDLSVYSSDRIIYVNNSTVQNGDLLLYDAMGRVVEKVPFKANKETAISTKLQSGFYVAKACTSKNTVIINFILK